MRDVPSLTLTFHCDCTAAHMIMLLNAFRVVSGLNLYVLTGTAAMLIQTSILYQDAVRRISRIPLLPKNTSTKPVTFQESIDHLKKWFHDQNRIARAGACRKGSKW
ncbi:hypothetical protein EDB92DRAFT_1832179 [Lactarius akahatsu]|uniref:Uncharacterized protein n=1 Tax=Lactarius akahatsu TaxID=416441 RepID=A0AAD4LN32_9AGAM|nr:hypothetical protein EDB92DRAFT_1832179 [Lactarius akahatsu]